MKHGAYVSNFTFTILNIQFGAFIVIGACIVLVLISYYV
jgi:hypothetical protein